MTSKNGVGTRFACNKRKPLVATMNLHQKPRTMKTATLKQQANSAFAQSPLIKLCRTCAMVGFVAAASPFQASAVSVVFEAGALGNIGPGNTNTTVNDGGTLDTPIAGKLELGGPVGSGLGTVLYVQTNGLAGLGTVAAPLFVTLTARSHLDNPNSNISDFQAGNFYITASDGTVKDNGLGVRPFTVDNSGNREAGNNPAIEGSKEVSGGTDPLSFAQRLAAGKVDGAPHVDERVLFTFAKPVLGSSINVVLTKFDATGTNGGLNNSEDVFDLIISRMSLPDLTFDNVRRSVPPGSAMMTYIGAEADQVVNLNFAGLLAYGLGVTDVVTSFSIRANDDNPSSPQGTAEHFLIDGLTATLPPPSVPDGGSTIALLGLALVLLPAAKAFQNKFAVRC